MLIDIYLNNAPVDTYKVSILLLAHNGQIL